MAGHRHGIHRRGLARARGSPSAISRRSPKLDPTKSVKENVMDGVRGVADMMERFNEISTLMADPPEDADFEALMEEMGTLQDKIDAVDGWTLDNQLEIAMEALRCPPGDWSGR
ncbi:Energy-dependent translational throttle protein EttA [Aphelenchoides bicaudatus]|nr:Energy-dependent translational throttle protein EttA [Aphelenchoides bicaudatus]